jgi:hypothetical protein
LESAKREKLADEIRKIFSKICVSMDLIKQYSDQTGREFYKKCHTQIMSTPNINCVEPCPLGNLGLGLHYLF